MKYFSVKVHGVSPEDAVYIASFCSTVVKGDHKCEMARDVSGSYSIAAIFGVESAPERLIAALLSGIVQYYSVSSQPLVKADVAEEDQGTEEIGVYKKPEAAETTDKVPVTEDHPEGIEVPTDESTGEEHQGVEEPTDEEPTTEDHPEGAEAPTEESAGEEHPEAGEPAAEEHQEAEETHAEESVSEEHQEAGEPTAEESTAEEQPDDGETLNVALSNALAKQLGMEVPASGAHQETEKPAAGGTVTEEPIVEKTAEESFMQLLYNDLSVSDTEDLIALAIATHVGYDDDTTEMLKKVVHKVVYLMKARKDVSWKQVWKPVKGVDWKGFNPKRAYLIQPQLARPVGAHVSQKIQFPTFLKNCIHQSLYWKNMQEAGSPATGKERTTAGSDEDSSK